MAVAIASIHRSTRPSASWGVDIAVFDLCHELVVRDKIIVAALFIGCVAGWIRATPSVLSRRAFGITIALLIEHTVETGQSPICQIGFVLPQDGHPKVVDAVGEIREPSFGILHRQQESRCCHRVPCVNIVNLDSVKALIGALFLNAILY